MTNPSELLSLESIRLNAPLWKDYENVATVNQLYFYENRKRMVSTHFKYLFILITGLTKTFFLVNYKAEANLFLFNELLVNFFFQCWG